MGPLLNAGPWGPREGARRGRPTAMRSSGVQGQTDTLAETQPPKQTGQAQGLQSPLFLGFLEMLAQLGSLTFQCLDSVFGPHERTEDSSWLGPCSPSPYSASGWGRRSACEPPALTDSLVPQGGLSQAEWAASPPSHQVPQDLRPPGFSP